MSDDEADPFDAFEDYRDREGDPFERLNDRPGDDDAGEDAGTDANDPAGDEHVEPEPTPDGDPDPFEYMDDRGPQSAGGADASAGSGDERSDGPRAGAGPGDVSDTDPFADVEVSDADPFESGASAFEQTGVDGVDPDEVWERLTAEPDSEPSADEDEDDVVEVSKHRYCEGCEFFSPPPDVECSHEGTTILEFVDFETVRVSNCPVVAERRELEDIEK